MKAKKLTFLEFLERVEELFGDRFDFSEVVWPARPSYDKIRILCPDHGVILYTPYLFLKNPEGCGKCGRQKHNERVLLSNKEKGFNDFLKKAKAKYGDKFDYSKVKYRKARENVLILCPEHGEFSVTPHNFLYSENGCPQCGREKGRQILQKRLSHPDGWNRFLQEAREKFGDRFSFKKEEFKNFVSPITITCSVHGPFQNTPIGFLKKKTGCAKCSYEKQKKIRITFDEFIRRARERFGDKYDYSRAEFKSMTDKLLIVCPEHGEFWKRPFGHLYSQEGCTRCAHMKKHKLPSWKTKAAFLKEAKEKYENFFDYSKVRKEDLKKEVIITCPEHGEFMTTPYKHLRVFLNGCPKCSHQYRKTEFVIFIQKACKKFGQRFDYSLFEWKGTREKGMIRCKKHGTFFSTPVNHLSTKFGCKDCAKEFLSESYPKITLENFLARAKKKHANRYDYKMVRIGKSGQPVKIICSKHGVFKQKLQTHLSGGGCPICAKEVLRLDQKEALARCKKVHGEKYDYSHMQYKSSTIPLKIRCPKHGFFYQRINTHISGNGCQKCLKEKMRMDRQEKFIQEAKKKFKNKFSYSAVRYENLYKKVKIRCPHHGYFEQTPNIHLRAEYGCPTCFKETQKNFKRNKSFYSDKSKSKD